MSEASQLGRRQVLQNHSYLHAIMNTDKVLRLFSLKEITLPAFPQRLFPISIKKALLYEGQIHITNVSGRILGPQSSFKANSPRD